MKISASAFQELHEIASQAHYTKAPNEGLWRGYRVIEFDGSTIRLPRSDELERVFGLYPGQEEASKYPVMAHI